MSVFFYFVLILGALGSWIMGHEAVAAGLFGAAGILAAVQVWRDMRGRG